MLRRSLPLVDRSLFPRWSCHRWGMLPTLRTLKATSMGYGSMTQTQNNFPRLPLLFALIPFIFCTPNAFAQADTVDVMKTPAHLAMQKLAWLEGVWEGEGDVPEAGKYISQMTYVADLN